MYFYIYPASKTPSTNNLLTPEFWLLTSSLQDTIREIGDTCFGHDTSCPCFFQNPQLATQNSLLITHYSSLITVFFPLYLLMSAISLVRRKSSRLFPK